MTRDMLKDAGYKFHHESWCRGYVSRKIDTAKIEAVPYKGKFGEGYTVKTPSWKSTSYCIIEYWVK